MYVRINTAGDISRRRSDLKPLTDTLITQEGRSFKLLVYHFLRKYTNPMVRSVVPLNELILMPMGSDTFSW